MYIHIKCTKKFSLTDLFLDYMYFERMSAKYINENLSVFYNSFGTNERLLVIERSER